MKFRATAADRAEILAAAWAAERASFVRGGSTAPAWLGRNPAWLRKAEAFAAWCGDEGVDPGEAVASLFDYARVRRAAGVRFAPSLARSPFTLRLARARAAKRLALRADPTASGEALRRRVASAEAAARALMARRPERARAPRGADAALGADAAAWLARRRRWPRLDDADVADMDPGAFSALFRRLAAIGPKSDEERAAANALAALGVPADVVGARRMSPQPQAK